MAGQHRRSHAGAPGYRHRGGLALAVAAALVTLPSAAIQGRDSRTGDTAPTTAALATVTDLRASFLEDRLDPLERKRYVGAVLFLAESRHEAATLELLVETRTPLRLPEELEATGDLALYIAYAQHAEGDMEGACTTLRAFAGSVGPSTELYRALVVLAGYRLQAGALAEAERWDAEARRTFEALQENASSTELIELRLTDLHSRLGALASLGLMDLFLPVLEEYEALAPRSSTPAWVRMAFNERLEWLNRTMQFPEAAALGKSALDGGLFADFPAYRVFARLRTGIALSFTGDDVGALSSFESVASDAAAALVERTQACSRMAEILFDRGEIEEARARLAQARELFAGMTGKASDEEMSLLAISSVIEGAELDSLRSAFAAFVERNRSVPPRGGGFAPFQSHRRRGFLAELMRAEMRAATGAAGSAAALEILYRAQTCSSVARKALEKRGRSEMGGFSALRARFVDADSGLLVFFASRRTGFVFAIDDTEVVTAEIPSYFELEPLRRDLASWETLPSEQRARGLPQSAKALAKALLPSVVAARLERWHEVTIVGRDLVGPFSFELLPLPSGTLLGERLAVGYLPSLPLGVVLDESAHGPLEQGTLALALIAAPGTGSDVDPAGNELPVIPLEADHVRRLTYGFDEERVLRLLGKGATVHALHGAEATRARAWLLLAHAFPDPERERTPVLQLDPADGSSGKLGCLEVEDLAVPGLVVVAACRAGSGPERPGDDGASHLGGAFLASGADVVVLPSRPIEYETVLALLPVFWARLREGATPARALLEARRALRAERKTDDPALGLMHVVGLAHRPVF